MNIREGEAQGSKHYKLMLKEGSLGIVKTQKNSEIFLHFQIDAKSLFDEKKIPYFFGRGQKKFPRTNSGQIVPAGTNLSQIWDKLSRPLFGLETGSETARMEEFVP